MFVVDVSGNRNRLFGTLWAERDKIRKIVQKQLSGFEAHTIGANIEDSILHGLESFGDFGDRAAVSFDKIDLVIRFLGDATRYFRYEKSPLFESHRLRVQQGGQYRFSV